MRAAKDDTLRVTRIISKVRQVALHDRLGDRAVIPAFLRKGNEQLTGELSHCRASVQAQQGLSIRAQPNGRLGGEDEVSPTRPGRHRSGRPGLHNPYDRQRVHLFAKRLQRDCGSRITCHDQQLDVALLQQSRCLTCIAGNRRGALGAVRQASRITQVDQILVRHRLAQRFEHRQAANTGIKYANWQAFCVRCIHHSIVLWTRGAIEYNADMQKILYGTGGLIALLILVGLALPRYARIDVETKIEAHPASVFALVNDFRRVALWTPWLDTDPNARIVHSGPPRGVGATMTWDGAIIGTGTQIITESRAHEHVATSINPGEAGEARTWFDLSGSGDTTMVSWRFETDYGFNVVGRYFGLVFAGVVRRDYTAGLAKLKEFAETLPSADFSDLAIEQLVVQAAEIAYLSTASIPEPAAISEAMGDAYFEILSFIDENGLNEAGAPLSITRSFSGSELLFDAAIPVRGVTDATPRDSALVKIGQTYAGDVIRVRHIGSYRTLGTTHRKIAAYLAALGLERAGDAWESYVSDPTKVPESELLTYVYYPVNST